MDNTQPQQHTDLKQQILEKINTGKVSMKPRAYFVFQVVCVAILVGIIALFSAAIVSFLLFSLSVTGHLALLGFGGRGLYMFFLTFPWGMLLIVAVLLFILDRLIARFKFAYHRPFIYLFLGSMAFIMFAAYLITITPIHDYILRRSEDHGDVPLVGPLYKDLRRPHRQPGMFRGVVTAIEGDTFLIAGDDPFENATDTVIAPPGFHLSDFLHIGDRVFVAGDEMGDMIRAYGIQKLNLSR